MLTVKDLKVGDKFILGAPSLGDEDNYSYLCVEMPQAVLDISDNEYSRLVLRSDYSIRYLRTVSKVVVLKRIDVTV